MIMILILLLIINILLTTYLIFGIYHIAKNQIKTIKIQVSYFKKIIEILEFSIQNTIITKDIEE